MENTSPVEGRLSKEKEDARISPLSGAERLFLGGVFEASNISAKMLTEQLQQNNNLFYNRQHKQLKSNGRIRKTGSFHTAQTRGGSIGSADDFVTCAEISFDTDSVASNENFLNSPFTDPLSNNSKVLNDNISKGYTEVMASEGQKTAKDVETSTVSDEGHMKVHVAEFVYGKAKGILQWGKSVPLVSFFVGTSEEVAGKALGVVGTDLHKLDGKIECELSKFDSGFLNPAIEAIVNIVVGVAGKSEETLKPIIGILLKPLGLLIKSEANESSPNAHTENPEVTASK